MNIVSSFTDPHVRPSHAVLFLLSGKADGDLYRISRTTTQFMVNKWDNI